MAVMYPEDRVLVAFVPRPADFALAQEAGWYRIPLAHAPKGLHAEYIAFYFGGRFGPEKWAISYYAENRGHELARRRDLLPEQSAHPRADDIYYKVQLGPLQRLEQPIISLRWRRITFLHTTWDRFRDATEINDLFLKGEPYVDRVYATLKERGLQPECNYRIEERGLSYDVALAIPCQDGTVTMNGDVAPANDAELDAIVTCLHRQALALGGATIKPRAEAAPVGVDDL